MTSRDYVKAVGVTMDAWKQHLSILGCADSYSDSGDATKEHTVKALI